VSATDASFAALPARLEGGTPNVAGAVGLAAAADFIDSIGRSAIDAHVDALRAQAVAGLAALPGVTVLSPEATPSAIVSFAADGVHPHDIGTLLDERGIAVRTGHHCAQPLLDHLGLGRPRAPRSRSTTRTPKSTAWWPAWRVRWRCCDERRPPCRPDTDRRRRALPGRGPGAQARAAPLRHLSAPTHQARGHNPQCGDDLQVELLMAGDQVKDIRFSGQGCAICIASASMMTEAVHRPRRGRSAGSCSSASAPC
jgi:hypothetical protein